MCIRDSHIGELPRLNEICHIHEELVDSRADHCVRDLRDHQFVSVCLSSSEFYLDLSAELDLSSTSLVDL